MKYLLTISLAFIPFFSFSQIEFTGYIQDSKSHQPIADVQISVKGSDVSAENVFPSVTNGFFIIKFDPKSVNKSFQLKISHKDFFSAVYFEVVMSTKQPKTYYLKSKVTPLPPLKRPAETARKPEPVQEQKQQAVNNGTKPQTPVDTNQVKTTDKSSSTHETPDTKDYPALGRDPLNKTGNRYLTDTDKNMIREQLVDHTKKAFVCFQRGNEEARRYALEILAYTKQLGFTGNVLYYQPPSVGRLDITTENRMYKVNVLVRLPE
jgi:hypothetical protein